MSSRDPRVVKVALEDLREESRLWSTKASYSLAIAGQTHALVREEVERAVHRAAVVHHEAQVDHDRVTDVITAGREQSRLADSATGDSQATLEQSQGALVKASSVLSFWEDQLQKARAWLARAEARLERAIANYQSALAGVQQAKWTLERAEARYDDCKRDKNRSNCDGEYRAVVSANNDLQQALYTLQLAETELSNARDEVAAAKARVECCSRAVDYGKKAVEVAKQAASYAELAVSSAERSLELAGSSLRHAGLAETSVIEEVEVAEKMVAATREAVSQTDLANMRLTSADKLEESAQRNLRNADQSLRYKLDQLQEMDRADLHT